MSWINRDIDRVGQAPTTLSRGFQAIADRWLSPQISQPLNLSPVAVPLRA